MTKKVIDLKHETDTFILLLQKQNGVSHVALLDSVFDTPFFRLRCVRCCTTRRTAAVVNTTMPTSITLKQKKGI